MMPPAFSHIHRYYRVAFDRGQISAGDALHAMLDAGLADTSPLAIQMTIETRWLAGADREARQLAIEAMGRWPNRIWFKYASALSASRVGDSNDAIRLAMELLADERLALPLTHQLAGKALEKGLKYVASAPLVRSSYNAAEGMKHMEKKQ